MLVAWKYKHRDTIIQRLDPRARWIFLFAMTFSIIQFWDIRFLFFFFVISFTQYFLCRLTWKETRRIWTFVLILVIVIIGINALLTGRGGPAEVLRGDKHILWEVKIVIPWVGWTIRPNITVEKVVFAVTQWVRMLGITVLFIPLAFTFNPNEYGITFRGLGLTLDSQRARGYEVEKLEGGLFAQIRKTAPLIVPVTINSIVGAEDIINAMDLRCFGLRKRTWMKELHYTTKDYVLIGIAVLILAASCTFNWVLGVGSFWMPDWIFPFFGF
jgi:energy-coupling factor transport system permease protein